MLAHGFEAINTDGGILAWKTNRMQIPTSIFRWKILIKIPLFLLSAEKPFDRGRGFCYNDFTFLHKDWGGFLCAWQLRKNRQLQAM